MELCKVEVFWVLGHDLSVVCRSRGKSSLLEVMCDPNGIMSDSDSLSTGVRIFMTEKEALWHEFEHGFS